MTDRDPFRASTAAAIMLAAITTASAAEYRIGQLNSIAATLVYHESCGQTVPSPVIASLKLAVRVMTVSERKTYSEQAVKYWGLRQKLGDDFCSDLKPGVENVTRAILGPAIELGL
jgi:hypothetical protein